MSKNQGAKGKQKHPGYGAAQREPEGKYLSEPLTPKTLRKETRAATNLAYRPTERAINSERRASVQRTKDLGNWWNEYLSTVQQGQGSTAAAYQTAANQATGAINASSAIDNANTARLSNDAAASAAVRGQTAPTQPAERGAAAQAQRNYLSSAQTGATAQRGANQFAYLGEQNRIGKGQSIAARVNEQKRTRTIESDKRELAKQRGEYATKFRGEAIKNNHDYLIQRQAYGLDKAKLHTEKAEAAQAAAAAAAKESNSLHQQEIENRQKQQEINNEPKPGKNGKTSAEEQASKQGRHNAMVAAKSYYAQIPGPKKPTTAAQWAAFQTIIESKDEVTPTEAAWAVKRLRAQYENREQKEYQEGKTNLGPPAGHGH